MDIKIIISMFEDLKKLISEQFGKLSKQIESAAKEQSGQPLLPIIQQIDLSELEGATAHTNALIKSEFKKYQEQLHELKQKFNEQKDVSLPIQKHLHTIELKSSKVVIALLSLGVLLFGSLICNFYQLSENNRLTDNDIKFRYVKAMGEISAENLLKLETIFEYKPNKQKKKALHQWVEDYERTIKEKIVLEEQARLKQIETQQLNRKSKALK